MDDFDQANDQALWNFDVFKYHETLGDSALMHFGIRIFMRYGLIDKFSISEGNLKNLLKNIGMETYETTQFHNIRRTIDVTRNFHYFVKFGNLMKHISDLHVMAGFLASMINDVSHPGVTNNYLVGTKHAKALRYNDQAVLENHHCAIAFKIMLDPKNDIFELLSEAQYWNVRQLIIKMILSTDLANHFHLIMDFKGRMQKKQFPEDTNDDKQMVLDMTLYASNHCHPIKNSITYFKWIALEMEEYYQQGDIEKKLGYEVTPFFDRTTSNPFQFQLGYIEVIVEPLIASWSEFLPQSCRNTLTKGLEENKKLMVQKIKETKELGHNDNGNTQEFQGSEEQEGSD